MQRKLSIGLILVALIMGAIYIINAESSSDSASYFYALSSAEEEELLEGDLILRRGYGFVSSMILKLMDEDLPVTHLGVLIKRSDTLFVVHSLSSSVSAHDGIQIQRLDSFVNNSHPGSIVVSRLKHRTAHQAQKIKNRLQYYLKQKIPFDHYFDPTDTSAFYCSELVWQIFEKDLQILHVDADYSDKDKYQQLKVFYDEKYFDIIVNHHR